MSLICIKITSHLQGFVPRLSLKLRQIAIRKQAIALAHQYGRRFIVMTIYNSKGRFMRA